MHQPVLPRVVFEYGLAAGVFLGPSPVGCLHAASLFWRLRVLTGGDSGRCVPAGLHAQECSQAHLIYLYRYNLMLTVIICPWISHHWAKLVSCCSYTSFFSAVPSAARGIKARVVCVFEIRSRCLHWEPWHWQQLRPGYASLVRAPSNAAFAMNPPFMVIPFSLSAVSEVAVSHFLIYVSLILSLLWNRCFLKEESQPK